MSYAGTVKEGQINVPSAIAIECWLEIHAQFHALMELLRWRMTKRSIVSIVIVLAKLAQGALQLVLPASEVYFCTKISAIFNAPTDF